MRTTISALVAIVCVSTHANCQVQQLVPMAEGLNTSISFAERKELLPETVNHHADTLRNLLQSLSTRDIDKFRWRGNSEFKKITESEFGKLADRWAESLNGTFDGQKLSELRRMYDTTVWKVRFEKTRKDALAVISTDKKGNIVSFELL